MPPKNTLSMRCACSTLFFDARRLSAAEQRFVLNADQHRKANITIFIVLVKIFSADTFSRTVRSTVQYVAQYPDGTSIRTLKTKTHFLRRRFQFSVNEVFRMKAGHFIFKTKVLASLKLVKHSQKTSFCSGE